MQKLILFLLVGSFLNASLTFAAMGDPQCPLSMSSSSGYLPPTGTLIALAIFVKFKDDTFDSSPATDGWPSSLQTLPSWAPDFLAPTTNSTYVPDGFSDYFDEMSLGQYQLIGDVYSDVYITPENESYYSPDSGRGIGFLNKQILQDLDTSINYADYDNLDPQDTDNDGIINEPDGEVDMIFIVYRAWRGNITGRNYQGVAALDNGIGSDGEGPSFFPITLDGKTIDGGFPGSGVVQNNVYNLPVAVAIHEFGHYLFGGVHFSGIGRFGIMDGSLGTGVMSAFERIKLGWVTPELITSNQTNVAITDWVTTGTVCKIEYTSNNYFLVENRQAVSYYETTSPLATPEKGILITHVTGTNSIDVECADGRWNWKKSGSLYVYPFEIQSSNPDFGEDEINLRNKSTTSGTKTHPDAGGDGDDIYRLNSKTDFAPWTNPSSNSGSIFTDIAVILKQLSGSTMYVDIYTNSPPTVPQNLVIANAGQNGQSPILQWDANTEPDLDHYTIYRGYNDLETGQIIWNSVATTTNTTWTDYDVTINTASQTTFRYKITAVDTASNESNYSNTVSTKGYWVPKHAVEPSEDQAQKLPKQITLHQNYPNPFNPVTEIRFDLPEDAQVVIKIYNVLGEEVRTLVDNHMEIGFHSVIWDGRDETGRELPSGIYIYRFQVSSGNVAGNSFVSVKKLTLLR
ncbi:MAG: FlgD immunoglobulin-like domain containing protein [Calditrichia bacterium]